ncbi:MAG: hypothetical protein H5T34_02020 [Candidatus Methanomethyliales bacterium]|nr:hypothetical protein [Candidatus Methanomethylicales archaeon]
MNARAASLPPIFLIFLIVCFVGINAATNATTIVFSLSPDNVCCEVWGGFNGDAAGRSYYDLLNEKFVMWINDTSGSWGLSKLSRGLMPHYWGLRHGLLDNEFEIKRGLPTQDLILEIDLKLVGYQNYTTSNSSSNVAIVFFFESLNPEVNYQVKCYQTELQFFSYYGDKVQKNQVWFFEWRNDSVAQFKLEDNLQPGVYRHYSLKLNKYIYQMMEHYNLEHVKLRHIEIFTEAYKGYCEFEVYSAKIYTEESLDFLNLMPLLIMIAIILLLCLLIFLIIYRKKKKNN